MHIVLELVHLFVETVTFLFKPLELVFAIVVEGRIAAGMTMTVAMAATVFRPMLFGFFLDV